MTWLLAPLKPVSIGCNVALAGSPVANLIDPQPKVVFAFGSGFTTNWNGVVIVDLGADMPIDTVGLLFHNGSATGTWSAWYRAAAQGAFAANFDTAGATLWFGSRSWRSGGEAPRYHAVYAGSQITARYIKLFPASPDASNPNWLAGVLAIGMRLEPGAGTNEMRGFDWGAGWRANDLSEVRTHDGGEQSSWRRAVVPEVRGTFSHLTDAEVNALKALILAAGKTQPLLLMEAADTLGVAGIHYGSLIDVDFFERRMPDKSRFELRLRNWL